MELPPEITARFGSATPFFIRESRWIYSRRNTSSGLTECEPEGLLK
jgi:hypothetical protein